MHTIGASSLSMGQYVPTLQGSHDDLSAETYVPFMQAIAMLVLGQLKKRQSVNQYQDMIKLKTASIKMLTEICRNVKLTIQNA